MILKMVLWGLAGVWLGVGLSLLLLYLGYGLFGSPPRTWRERLRDLAVNLPLFLGVVVIGWPISVIVVFFQLRRDVILENACFGNGTQKIPTPITERKWTRGHNAVDLLAGLPTPPSERKRRLFACACCRRIWERLHDDRSRRAVEIAERLADGKVQPDEVRTATVQAGGVASSLLSQGDLEAGAAAKACLDCLRADARSAAERASVSNFRSRFRERRAQAEILREIIGNPFRPLMPRTFPPELMELARACHEGDHALYPLLADALEDMGEVDAANHCRTSKHLRGCYVVDWILGHL